MDICALIRVRDVYLATYLLLERKRVGVGAGDASPLRPQTTGLIQRGPTHKLVSDLGLCVLVCKDDLGQSFELRE